MLDVHTVKSTYYKLIRDEEKKIPRLEKTSEN